MLRCRSCRRQQPLFMLSLYAEMLVALLSSQEKGIKYKKMLCDEQELPEL